MDKVIDRGEVTSHHKVTHLRGQIGIPNRSTSCEPNKGPKQKKKKR